MSPLVLMFALLVLALTIYCSSASVVTCSEYKADNTDNAVTYACTCKVLVCPGQYLTINGCGSCSGTQYLRLYRSDGALMAQVSGESSSCAPCALLRNFRPTNLTSCRSFALNEGCAANSECRGNVTMFVTNSTLSSDAMRAMSIVTDNRYAAAAVQNQLRSAGEGDIEGPFVSPLNRRRRGRNPTRATVISESSRQGYCGYEVMRLSAGELSGIIIGSLFGAAVFAGFVHVMWTKRLAKDNTKSTIYAGVFVKDATVVPDAYEIVGEDVPT